MYGGNGPGRTGVLVQPGPRSSRCPRRRAGVRWPGPSSAWQVTCHPLRDGSSSRTSSPSSGTSENPCIRGVLDHSSSAMTEVPALPTDSQMTFGGGPYKKARWRKSLSLETMVKPC